jgi:uncharacterized membrane protein
VDVRSLTVPFDGFLEVVVRNRFWMTWNLLLAAVPAALAPVVFRHRGPRSATWWLALAVVLLFLPNAPYVVTDLVHLRGDVVLAGSDLDVVAGVLPAYALFIAAGFACYAVVISEGRRFLEDAGLAVWRPAAELAVHAVCAVGVVLGRVARLNSWEPVTEPVGTLERVVLTLSWRWAPVAVVATFLVIWAGHAVTRAAARAAVSGTTSLVATWRSALDGGPHLGGP